MTRSPEPADDADTGRSVTPDEAVAWAVEAMRARHFAEAAGVLAEVLTVLPDHPDALHFSGLLAAQNGDEAEAARLVRRSLAVLPTNPHAWNNLGNLLQRAGDGTAAAEAYMRCLEIVPDFPEALTNIGFMLRTEGDVDAAERLYRRALAVRPDFVEALNNLATVLMARGDNPEAERLLRRAIELEPGFGDAYTNLGDALERQGKREEAAAFFWKAIAVDRGDRMARKLLIYALVETGQRDKAIEVAREWVEIHPDDPRARHHLAAVTGENVPERASDAYVEDVFDRFAATFDGSLGRLGYQAPRLVADLLARLDPPPAGDLAILDAGCGTGLVGPLVRDRAKTLVGLDLSAGMLAKAEARGCYDDLVKGELTAALAADHERWDVIVCADTFCYFGDLHAAFAAARGALRPGGRLVFTVEALADDDRRGFRLHEGNGRYAHALAHVDAAFAAAGLERIDLDRAELRMEGGKPVAGLVVAARRPH